MKTTTLVALICIFLLACDKPQEQTSKISLSSIDKFPLAQQVELVPISKAWAQNSINAVIFRHNSVVSHEDTQYVAFYNPESQVVLAKRNLGEREWQMDITQFTGNTKDAHNTISIMVDGEGYLHMSWDHHGHPLRYSRSVAPGSLEMSEMMPMTGIKEGKVTYPEFYRLANGNLIFLYRDGSSGNGNLMMNHYDTSTQKWTQVQDAFINGEGERNAYWQTFVDVQGTIHISWVWRESGDVATNHDLCYARSKDGGKTWENSIGEAYEVPITAGNAEYAWEIPQKSELINTTSMYADENGNPYIASYWREQDSEIPQYFLVYKKDGKWTNSQISQRQTPFSLSGGGTKRIPISRPRMVVNAENGQKKAYLIYRDQEQGNRVSAAICENLDQPEWSFVNLSDEVVDLWEPSYDTELWKSSKQLHIYFQRVEQGDRETTKALEPQVVSVLEWKP